VACTQTDYCAITTTLSSREEAHPRVRKGEGLGGAANTTRPAAVQQRDSREVQSRCARVEVCDRLGRRARREQAHKGVQQRVQRALLRFAAVPRDQLAKVGHTLRGGEASGKRRVVRVERKAPAR